MPDDTSQVSAIAGYQPAEAGLASQITAIAGYQPTEAGLASQLVTLVGYIPPDPPVATVPDITGTVGNPATFDGSGATGPADTTLRWAWTSVPAGSTVAPATTLPFPFPDGTAVTPIAMPNNQAATPVDMTDNELLVHADGNLDDSSGNSRNGTAVNGQSFTTGKVTGQALIFDGSNSVTFGNNLQYTSGDFTYALWMKPTSGQTQPQWQQVFGVYGGTYTGHYMVQNDNNQNEYTFTGNPGSYWQSWNSTITLTAGIWTHVAFVRQGTRITCYVNGRLAYDDPDDIAATVDNNNGLFTIGGANGGTGWRGEIDEFANWSRALSASEIKNIYDLQKGWENPSTPIDMTDNVGLWHLDGNADDTSGNNNNGTVNGATLATGKIGQCYDFDGSNDYIEVAHSSELDASSALTIAAWIWADDHGAWSGIVTKGTNAANYSFQLSSSGSGQLQFFSGGSPYTNYVRSTAVMPIGQWMHVAVTWDAGTVKFFINGVLDSTHSVAWTLTANSESLTFGCDFPGSDEYFNGKIDEIAIWTRVLSASEIENIYALQAPLFTPTPLPDNAVSNTFDLSMASNEGLYHFEGNANDSSGNGRNGTVSGATLTTGKVGSNAYAFVQADSTDVITFGTAGFNFVSADAFSFALWVKPDASQPDANAIILSKSNFSTTGYAIIQNGGANSNQYTFIVGTGAGLSGIGSNFALTAGAWNHVAVTRAANGTSTKVYVNGAQVANVSFLTAIASSDPIPLGIGNLGPAPGTSGLVFNGDIDELAIWSRELTPLEVETVYDYGNGTYVGFGETFTFTPDVAGTYTVEAQAVSLWGSDLVTADAVIAAASGAGSNSRYGLLSGLRLNRDAFFSGNVVKRIVKRKK